MVRDLQAAGAQALAMPCNTAHAYAADIVAATPLPFLDMRSATVAVLPKGRIGMPAVRLTGALDGHFAASDLTPIWAKEAAVLALIKAVKRGDVGAAAHAEMARRLAAEMAARSDHILVACTELSLLTGSIATPFTDSLDCLVQAILDFARG